MSDIGFAVSFIGSCVCFGLALGSSIGFIDIKHRP